MQLSIVIPALNEAGNIVATLMPLQPMRTRGTEVILADGGSADHTPLLAAPLVDRVIHTRKGRAAQMNAGAAIAAGDTLLFLHADSILPAEADVLIGNGLQSASRTWGRFDVTIKGQHFFLPVVAWFMNHRSRLTGIATGDQGLFMTADTFTAAGGFAEMPLMEDVAMCVTLRKAGAPLCVAQKIVTSGRRWEKHGVWRTIFLMWRLRLAYFLGADPAALHRAYYGK
ncbi:MAG: TIGR04283 family arsenosugar biosynthesis glycosyltransferase [Burkholderiales bacterium]|nr:TIGR04283 family arsenosugar biosynthesis glycosyltransferase [Burkholderiales bacterium]